MTSPGGRLLAAEVVIGASPSRVWRVVADLRRTPEWSPECRRVVAFGAVRAGTFLLGLNRRGRVWWPTLSRVVRYRAEREIAWHVTSSGATWTYRLEPEGVATRLVETRSMPGGEGPRIARWFAARFLGGVAGHDAELSNGMERGLQRVKDLVER